MEKYLDFYKGTFNYTPNLVPEWELISVFSSKPIF